jgi:hypothetical protein
MYQSGWLVAGADFDWSAMNMKGSGRTSSTAAAPAFVVESLGSRRGRRRLHCHVGGAHWRRE